MKKIEYSGLQPPRPADTPPVEGNIKVEMKKIEEDKKMVKKNTENSHPLGGVGCAASRGGTKVSNESTKIRRSYRKYSELPKILRATENTQSYHSTPS